MNQDSTQVPLQTDQCVRERYSAASKSQEPTLCCPINYDQKYLEVIPQEIIDRDYGCGDPSPYVRRGDTVVDLGSGGGKLCFIISQLVGPEGQVIGIDVNPDMLALARKYQQQVAERIGHDNIQFRCGRIQDLAIDLEAMADEINRLATGGVNGAMKVISLSEEIRHHRPMISDNSVDCVVSNCVLNLVRPEDRNQLFTEIFRVLKPGGRAAISDIVSDEDVPHAMQQDASLWSGCISGAWREDRFAQAFVQAGFQGIVIDKRQTEPWQTVEGIEFRSVTILAYKPFGDVCLERNQAVIYRGPFKKVVDDDGREYHRAKRMAVCDKTFQMLGESAFAGQFYLIEPLTDIPVDQANAFDCSLDRVRDPRETKGKSYRLTIVSDDQCCGGGPNDSCC